MLKRINYTLKSGLIATSAKLVKGRPIATVFVTDLTHDVRVLLDLEGRRVIHSTIDLSESDIKELFDAILKE